MPSGETIAEFLASVGFTADEASLKSALGKVAAFGASISVLAGGIFASLVGVAQAEVEVAAQADKLGMATERLEEMRFVAEQTGSDADKLTAALETIASKTPQIRNTADAFDMVSRNMRGMNEIQRKVYAERLGIDYSLIPMMTEDVSALREEFQAMYAVAGTDAKAAAEASKDFLDEIGKLKTLAGMLAKSVSLSFLGGVRNSVETMRRAVMENFAKIQRVLQVIIGFVMRMAGVISALVYRIIHWASALVGWFDSLSDGQRKLVIGAGLLLAAWRMLNLSFLATPLGMLVAGLAAIVALVDDYLTYMEGGESYFDWGPWAASIEQCLSILKAVWNIVYALGAAIISALGPAFDVVLEELGLLWRTIGNIGQFLYQVFTGDFSGALDTAKTLFEDWSETGQRIVSLLCDAITNFFSRLWAGITEDFPDFAKWAEDAGDSIRNAFGDAVAWVKNKLKSLVDFLPDFVLEELGWKKPEEEKDDGEQKEREPEKKPERHPLPETETPKPKRREKPERRPDPDLPVWMKEEGRPGAPRELPDWMKTAKEPYVPDLARPVLLPTPSRQADIGLDRRSVNLDVKTDINVNGVDNPEETARRVAAQQDHVNADLVRHTKGAVL